jgi:hypothetical protein
MKQSFTTSLSLFAVAQANQISPNEIIANFAENLL